MNRRNRRSRSSNSSRRKQEEKVVKSILHPLHQKKSEEASKEAERRIDDDFGNLTGVLQSYVGEHKVLPYCMILHSLAYRYLGGGLLDPTYKDAEFPYRSSSQFTVTF